MTKPNYITANGAFDDWRDNVLQGTPPTFYPVAESGPLARFELGPRLITLIGGAPGGGKTAFVMQCVVDALRLSPTLRAVVCNVEMPPEVLLDRQLSRLSGVALDAIRFRTIDAHQAERIDVGLSALDALSDRLAFVRPPFTLENVAATADDFAPLTDGGGLLLVLDYIQRIAPPGVQGDKRGSVDSSMNYLRQFADAGAAVIVVSSVGRQKNSQGSSTYAADSLSLASFKESGELEFGADDAFILAPVGQGQVKLSHLKARHRRPEDILFQFDNSTQRFETLDDDGVTEATGSWSQALGAMWENTAPAGGEPWQA